LDKIERALNVWW